MPKKSVYTQITPIPSHIPRQLAIDMLHSHGEIIELNPLVLEHHPIKAPQSAAADEYFSVWHEITERIQYIPGAGKLGSGKISFKGVFHDMPWGLQTHIYAPMGIDLRNKWQIRGNQRGEPPEHRELGSGAPADGLYLREDVEIKCNITMIPFVKKELKASSATMVQRLVRKAELLDSGVLHAMFENGKLKSVNPAVRDSLLAAASGPGSRTLPQSPGLPPNSPRFPPPPSPGRPPLDSPRISSPGTRSSTFINPDNNEPVIYNPQESHVAPYHELRRQQDSRNSQYGTGSDSYSSYSQSQFAPHQNQQQSAYARQSQQYQPPQPQPQGPNSSQQGLAIELAGDAYYPQQMPSTATASGGSHLTPQQPLRNNSHNSNSNSMNNNNRYSNYSELSAHSPVHNTFSATGGSSSAGGTPVTNADVMSRGDSVSSRTPSSYYGGSQGQGAGAGAGSGYTIGATGTKTSPRPEQKGFNAAELASGRQ